MKIQVIAYMQLRSSLHFNELLTEFVCEEKGTSVNTISCDTEIKKDVEVNHFRFLLNNLPIQAILIYGFSIESCVTIRRL